ncbi:hypothetical protein Bca101_074988 [Brassica carinata]
MQESLFVSSTTPRLSYSPRRLRDSVTPSLSSMAHLVKESLFEAIIRRLSRWNRRLRLSPQQLRVSSRKSNLTISSDEISLDVELSDVLSFISAVKLDACSLPMSSVNLYAFDDERIKRDVKVSLYGRFKSYESCSKERTTTAIQESVTGCGVESREVNEWSHGSVFYPLVVGSVLHRLCLLVVTGVCFTLL